MSELLLPAPSFAPAAAQSPFSVEPRSDTHQRQLPCRHFRGPKNMKCGVEFDEWTMARALVRPTDTVIEFGARYGTTSCALANATKNSGRVVAVEPDGEALPYLLANRQQNQCAFAVLKGVLGTRALEFLKSKSDGYDSATKVVRAGVRGSSQRTGPHRAQTVPATTLESVETALGSRIDVALIDCEGCIETALSPKLAHQLKLILWEVRHSLDTRSKIDLRALRACNRATSSLSSFSMSAGGWRLFHH